jgi:DNA-binding response OmpR family regulator
MTASSCTPPPSFSCDANVSRGIVAIVDDDPDVSRALGVWVQMNDLRATHCISGEHLLQLIEQHEGTLFLRMGFGPSVQLPLLAAILDLNLPGITGFELAAKLRKLAPTLPLLVITALAEEDRVRYGNVPSGVTCLKKPFTLDEIEDALFPLIEH